MTAGKKPPGDANRLRPRRGITLSREAHGGLRELALMRGMSVSALIENLIREEGHRFNLDLIELGRREMKRLDAKRQKKKRSLSPRKSKKT